MAACGIITNPSSKKVKLKDLLKCAVSVEIDIMYR